MILRVLNFCVYMVWMFCDSQIVTLTEIFKVYVNRLTSLFKDGLTLSVTFGDSSPKGRAKGGEGTCLPLWGRCPKGGEGLPTL